MMTGYHQTYIEDVVLRKALTDIWRARCTACRWEGPRRYDQASALKDGDTHAPPKEWRVASSDRGNGGEEWQ